MYWKNELTLSQTEIICESFFSLLKRPLVKRSTDLADLAYQLYHAPFIVVAHNTDPDPIFFYANLCAQKLWDLSLEEFLQTPSRLTVEMMEVSERQKLLDRARTHGFVDDYTGVRVRKNGSRFEIGKTILWNLKDKDRNYAGQAATFSNWKELPIKNVV